MLSPSYGSGVAVINGGGEVGVGGRGVASGGTAVGVCVGVEDGVGETAVVVGVGVDVAVAAAVAEPVGGGELGDAGGLGVIPATSKAWIAPLSNAT